MLEIAGNVYRKIAYIVVELKLRLDCILSLFKSGEMEKNMGRERGVSRARALVDPRTQRVMDKGETRSWETVRGRGEARASGACVRGKGRVDAGVC